MNRSLIVAVAMLPFCLLGCVTQQGGALTVQAHRSEGHAVATLASFGTFEMELAAPYTSLAVLRLAAARRLERGEIPVEEAIRIQAVADTARAHLDAARAAAAAQDHDTARARLASASVLIDQEKSR